MSGQGAWARTDCHPPIALIAPLLAFVITLGGVVQSAGASGPSPTTTTVLCTPSTAVAGSPATTTCTASVSGSSPTGSVAWSQIGSGSLTFVSATCALSGGTCSVTATATAVGFVAIQAVYGGDSNNLPGSGIAGEKVVGRPSPGTHPSALGLCNGPPITIGALNDLTSQLAVIGQGALTAEQIAISDVNSYLASAGCGLTFKLDAQDYQLSNTLALSELQAMAASGINVVVGPLNSFTVKYILPTAESDHVVLISPSSTASRALLPSPNNYLFRTAPSEDTQGPAIAREMVSLGAKAAIIVYNNGFGNSVAPATSSSLKADDPSMIITQHSYDPSTVDFTSLITEIGNDYTTLAGMVGAAHVAILAISSEELGTILVQTSVLHPSLLSTTLPWFGSDGEVLDTVLVNPTYGPLTAQVRLPSTLFDFVYNSNTINFLNRISSSQETAILAGGFYAFGAYDDIWLAALSTLTAGANNGQAIQPVVLHVANNYFGLTGFLKLFPSGDRIPEPGYQIWKVVASGGGDIWLLAGTWKYDTDSITLVSPP